MDDINDVTPRTGAAYIVALLRYDIEAMNALAADVGTLVQSLAMLGASATAELAGIDKTLPTRERELMVANVLEETLRTVKK